MTATEYFENLAALHKEVQHRAGTEIHYTDLATEAANLHALRMKYPCVVFDRGTVSVEGSEYNPMVVRSCSLLFLTHVRDAGKASEVRAAFALTERIMTDFLHRMCRDRRAGTHRFLNRFTAVGSEAQPVYMTEANLYGHVLMFNLADPYNDRLCEAAFNDESV